MKVPLAQQIASDRLTPVEVITQAAIQTEDGKVYTAPRPARHSDLFKTHARIVEGILISPLAAGEQGFVTNSGRFVDREEALTIAAAAKQIIKKHGTLSRLFTEDLW